MRTTRDARSQRWTLPWCPALGGGSWRSCRQRKGGSTGPPPSVPPSAGVNVCTTCINPPYIYCVYIYVPINRLFSTCRLAFASARPLTASARSEAPRGGQGRLRAGRARGTGPGRGREGAGQGVGGPGRAGPGRARPAPGAAAAGGRRAGACAEPSPSRPRRCSRPLRSAAGPSAPARPPGPPPPPR